jgi:hypothetical protein
MSWMTGKAHPKVLFARSKGEGETMIDVLCTHGTHVGKRVAGRLPRRSADWPIPFMRTCRDIFDMHGCGKGGVSVLVRYIKWVFTPYFLFVKGKFFKLSLYRDDFFFSIGFIVPHTMTCDYDNTCNHTIEKSWKGRKNLRRVLWKMSLVLV